MEKMEVIVINSWELEKIIEEQFDKVYSIQRDEESQGNTLHLYKNIDSNLDEEDEKRINHYLFTSNIKHNTRSVLKYLCKVGKIEAGNYLVYVL